MGKKKIIVGVNDLATTHPEVAKLLFYKEEGTEYTYGSAKRTSFKCSSCNFIITNKTIRNVVHYGLSCPRCSDGISYPEKLMFNVLNQLNMEFEYQKKFEWSEGKKYDFYIPELKGGVIIETHGRQHYDKGFTKNIVENIQYQNKNDEFKKNLAVKNKIINYIIIDCKFSDLDYIKDNIEKSDIATLICLNEINWLKAHEYASGSFLKLVCDYWNGGLEQTSLIAKELKIHSTTVGTYLKRGAELGLCNYDPYMVRKKTLLSVRVQQEKSVVQIGTDNKVIKIWKTMSEAADNLGIKVQNIWRNCKGKCHSAGGFIWMYKDDYENSKVNISRHQEKIKLRKCNVTSIMQLSLDGEFIKEWKSIAIAMKELNIKSNSGITNVCKGKQKSAGGYKWMYKEEYEKYIQQQNSKILQ